MAHRRYGLLAIVALLGVLPSCEVPATHPLAATATERAKDDVELAEAMESNEQLGPAGVQGLALSQVIELRPRLDANDRARADRWIADHMRLFTDVYSAADVAAKLPRDAPFHRAERDFASWVTETRPDRLDRALARDLFALPPAAMPTLDRFALGIEQMRIDDAAMQAFVLYCARSREATDKLVSWMATSLAETKEYTLVDRLFGNALLVESSERAYPWSACPHPPWSRGRPLREFVRLWSASAAYPQVWRRGAMTLAATSPSLADPLVVSMLHQAWTLWPEQRGTLLYVIAQGAADDDHYRRPTISAGPQFEAEIGPRPRPEDLAAMVSMGPYAVEEVIQIWDTVLDVDSGEAPAGHLSEVFAAAVTVLPEVWPGEPANMHVDDGLLSVAVHLCRSGKRADIARMRDWLKGRAAARAITAKAVGAACKLHNPEPLTGPHTGERGC